MKRLDVILGPDVNEQIWAQMLHISEDSVTNAFKWEERLRREIEEIGDVPGHAIDEDASSRLGLRVHKCVFEGTYLIHYVVNAEAQAVEVINFRHGARLPRRGEP